MPDPIHTFNKGYYCEKDGLSLNDNKENRSGNCEIRDQWLECDECEYFGNRNKNEL